jgi:hypothetical protein
MRGIPVPRLHLFSTRADYERLAASDELFARLCFVRDGIYPSRDIPVIEGLLSLPDLGVINARRYDLGERYQVFPAKPRARVRQLPGKKRFTPYDYNLDVYLQFTPRGNWERNLIYGFFEVTYNNGVTRELFENIRKRVAKVYLKAPAYCRATTYVGEGALALQKEGYRLCGNPNLPDADDFRMKSAARRPRM